MDVLQKRVEEVNAPSIRESMHIYTILSLCVSGRYVYAFKHYDIFYRQCVAYIEIYLTDLCWCALSACTEQLYHTRALRCNNANCIMGKDK